MIQTKWIELVDCGNLGINWAAGKHENTVFLKNS